MSEHLFDVLIRRASSTGSRRGYVRVLAGFALGGFWASSEQLAEGKGRKGRRNRKNKRKRNKAATPPRSPVSCTPDCTNRVCGDDGCGGSCGSCAPEQLCDRGICVTGQGTCAAGDDVCVDIEKTCGGRNGYTCYCFTTMAGETRCGVSLPLSDCETCVSDAECAAFFPDVAGVFCSKDTGEVCQCGGVCYSPCPVE